MKKIIFTILLGTVLIISFHNKISANTVINDTPLAFHTYDNLPIEPYSKHRISWNNIYTSSGRSVRIHPFTVIELTKCKNGKDKDEFGNYCYHVRSYNSSTLLNNYWKRHRKDIEAAPKDGNLRNNYVIKKMN